MSVRPSVSGYPRPSVTMRRPCIVLLNSPFYLFFKKCYSQAISEFDGLSEFASACLRYKARFVLIVSFACRERQ
jgi:hypothetical protein